MKSKRFLNVSIGVFVASVGVGTPLMSPAQQYPNRTVRITVPFTPGGAVDFMARIVANKLSQSLNQQVIVDNRPGAGTVIGTDLVARAEPDGYNLLMANIAFGANPALHAKLPFYHIKDFTGVSLFCMLPSFLVVHPSLPVMNVEELVKLAKAKQGELSYASGGTGSLLHLTMERFKVVAGFKMTHVPYKGAAPALSDVLGGQLAILFIPGPPALSHIKSNRLRALAVTSAERMPFLPEVPTIWQSGYPNFEMYDWEGLVAPAKTAPTVINQLNAALVKIVTLPEVKKLIADQGAFAMSSTPEELNSRIKNEVALWLEMVKKGNIQTE
jgi:tripartite-type tricarboxylate transporter receptor subunit TctC